MRKALLIALTLTAGKAFAGPHDFVVQLGHVGGDRTAAQPYIDQFMRAAEQGLKWPANSASGEFNAKQADAEQYIDSKKPAYGIFDVDTFLALRKKYDLIPIASVKLAPKYQLEHLTVVGKDANIKTVAGLKGKTIVSNYLNNPTFLSRVAFGSANVNFAKDFKLESTASPTKGLKALRDGAADATIVDDGQLAGMSQFGNFHVVQKSEQLPSTVVVSFGKQPDADAFAKMLLGLCAKGDLCKNLQIDKFVPTEKAAYDDAVKRYEK